MGEKQGFAARFANYPLRRLVAWFIDVLFVSLIVAFAFGEAALSGDPRTAFVIAASSALVGFVYFFVFASFSVTPGLALMRGSLSADVGSRFASAALFASMLLPLGLVLMILEPFYDVFGAFGAKVMV